MKSLDNKKLDIKLSDIVLFNKLGAGASATVKKAIHKPTKKVLALKEIRFSDKKEYRDAIISELTMMQECNHPNIIKTYGAFLTE